MNPYYEEVDLRGCVFDDTFLKEANFFDNWFFGNSNIGNIFEDDFADSLAKTIRKKFQKDILFDCITGDGSFDCSDFFDKQEEMVFPLIFTEVMIGLRFLRDKGNMVIKFFTFFHCKTISLLYFLSNCFANIICFKPCSSKHGNSEIYLVCRYFDRNVYLNHYSNLNQISADNFIFPRQIIPEEFIEAIFTTSKELAVRQSYKIESNVKLFHFENINLNDKDWKLSLAKSFIDYYHLECLNDDNDHLILQTKRIYTEIFIYNLKKKFFNIWEETETEKLIYFINKYNFSRPEFKLNNSKQLSIEINPKHGCSYKKLNNSKFVCIYMLKTFELIMNHCKNLCMEIPEPMTDYDFSYFLPLFETILTGKSLNLINNTMFLKIVEEKTMDMVEKQSNTKVHFLDLYDLTLNWNDNDFKICSSLRMEMANLIVNQKLKNGDSVCIRFNLILSRLNASLVYILATLFNRYSFNAISFTLLCQSPSLFCILDEFNSNRIATLNRYCPLLFDKLEPDWWNENLLELIAIPYLLMDNDFFKSLWFANNCCLLFYSKRLSIKFKKEIGFSFIS